MDLHALHGTLCLMTAYGQHVDARWLESFEAFAADVTPLPESIAGSPALRLYRIDPAKPWTRSNVAWAKHSGPMFCCDAVLAKQDAERRTYLQREARRQNSYVHETWSEAA